MSVGFTEALSLIEEHTQPVAKTEYILINRALGRILSHDIVARKNLPSFDNSAMDGFAFRSKDAGQRLRVARTIFAGDVPEASLQSGECYRIMTGAQVPADADTVAPFEQCDAITEDAVTVPRIDGGANVRKKGEEVKQGDVILPQGHRLDYGDIALLAAQGITGIKVYAKPSIAIIATGNEIIEPWDDADEDRIYNANAFGIKALLEYFGFEVHYVGALPDEPAALLQCIEGLRVYDVVLSTGGISKGDADFLYDALVQNGLAVWFNGIALKPGKGVTFGRMQNTYVMALPGNPLATMLTAHAFALPALFRIAGAQACHHTFTYAEFAYDLSFKPDRTDIVLGTMDNGVFVPFNKNKIGSGMLTPLSRSQAVAYIGEGYGRIERDDVIKIVLLHDTTRSERFFALNAR